MRVALVLECWEFPFNGVTVSSRRFVQALAERGFEFVILCAEGAEAPAVAGAERIRFPHMSLPGFNGIIAGMQSPLAKPVPAVLRRALKQVDLLHVQLPSFMGYKALQHARAQGIPAVCSFHVQPENILSHVKLTNSRLAQAMYQFWIRFIYEAADVIVAPSRFAADILCHHGLTRPVRVISNGVPERFFVAPLPHCGDRFRILSVGRLSREKRQATLLRAVQRSAWRRRIDLRFVGVGPDRLRLERLAERIGVKAVFESVDEPTLIERYQSADLFVHTGAIELEGIAVLEAMASGNTVIVSDSRLSASAAFATRPEAAFKADDAADLGRKIDFWLDREDERKCQGRENERIARRHSHAIAASGLADLYIEVARSQGVPSSSESAASGRSGFSERNTRHVETRRGTPPSVAR